MLPAQFGGLPGDVGLSLGVAVAVPVVVALALHLDARGRDTDHPLAFGVAALLGGLLGTAAADATTRLSVGVGVPLVVGLLYLTVRDELEESAPPVVGSGDVDTGDVVLGETVGPGDVDHDVGEGGDGDVGDGGDGDVGDDGDGRDSPADLGSPDSPSSTHPDPALGADDGADRDGDR